MMLSRQDQGLKEVLSAENLTATMLAGAGLAGVNLASHVHELMVCFPGQPFPRSLKAYSSMVHSAQFVSFKTAAATGMRLSVSDISREALLQLPQPSYMQLSKLQFLVKCKSIAANALGIIVCVNSCLAYRSGIDKFDKAVVDGVAPIAELGKSSSSHYLSVEQRPPSLVLRLGSAAQVASMLSNTAGSSGLQPLPVLCPGSWSSGRNQLDVALQRASSGLRRGVFVTLAYAPSALGQSGVPVSLNPAAGIIIQSGGLRTGKEQGSDGSATSADTAVGLAARIRSEPSFFPSTPKRVVVIHVSHPEGPYPLALNSSSSPQQLAWADGGVLSVDGRAALICGLLSWALAPAPIQERSKVVATSASGSASGSSSGASSKLKDKEKEREKRGKQKTLVVAAAPEPQSQALDPIWFAIEAVGGSVRAAMFGLQKTATAVSKAAVIGWGNVRETAVAAVRTAAGHLKLVLESPALVTLWGHLASTEPAAGEAHPIRRIQVYVDFPNAGGVQSAEDSLESVILSGLAFSGLKALPVKSSPAALAAAAGPGGLVLVRRSQQQGGDLAALQLAKVYARLGFRALAVTNSLSFDDLDAASTVGAGLSPTDANSALGSGNGGALTGCRDVRLAHSFCVERVALGVWTHCSQLLAGGADQVDVARDIDRDMTRLLARK